MEDEYLDARVPSSTPHLNVTRHFIHWNKGPRKKGGSGKELSPAYDYEV